MTNANLPSPQRLRALLDYDPESGRLIWKRRNGKNSATFNHCFAGKTAGTLRVDGYIAVKVDDAAHAAHRLIWAIAHGDWAECVRHRNRIDADNRLANLYAATRAEITEERRTVRTTSASALEGSGNL